jgi:electron transport complex protein RnfC
MNAVFAIREEFRRNTMRSCISCGECRNVCPVGLDPEELYKKILINDKRNLLQSLPSGLAEECHGCGCCEVVCPSMLPLSTKISSYAPGGN